MGIKPGRKGGEGERVAVRHDDLDPSNGAMVDLEGVAQLLARERRGAEGCEAW